MRLTYALASDKKHNVMGGQKNISDFSGLRLQGVTHYTLPCKSRAPDVPLWTPLKAGCALLSYALRLRIKERT